MEAFLKSYDGEKYVFTKLTLEDITSLQFSVESFKAHFVHPSYPLYLDSCDDLVLIDNEKRNVVLYNPTTQRLQFLPPTTIEAAPRSDTEKCRIDLNCTALGKDYTTGEIKVLRQVVCNYRTLDGLFKGCENKYELYSPRTGSWKRIEAPADDPVMLSHWASISVTGVYYWPAYFSKDGSWAIRTFDFATETFSTMPRAPKPPGNFLSILVELEGHLDGVSSLGSVVYQYEGEPKSFKLWSWRNPEWTLLKEFVLKNVDQPIGFVFGRFLFLEETVEQYPHRYRLKVYDCLLGNLKSFEIYDRAGHMKVVSYVKSSTALPNATELSACNKASYWDKYWEPILALSEDEDEDEDKEEATCSSSADLATALHSKLQTGASHASK